LFETVIWSINRWWRIFKRFIRWQINKHLLKVKCWNNYDIYDLQSLTEDYYRPHGSIVLSKIIVWIPLVWKIVSINDRIMSIH